jgi:hypothetical protein
MAFRQYTSCVGPSNYVDLSGTAIGFRNIFILVSSGAFAVWFIAVILGGAPAITAAIVLFTLVVTYLTWWLEGRLICLGGETCLIGVVTGAGPSNPMEKAGDNDFTMNVLLAPGPTNYNAATAEYWKPPQGHLVAEQQAILDIGRGYVQDADHKKYVTSLHCEFEGDGIYRMRLWAIVILALLVASLFLPPFLSGLAIILAIIAILAGLGDVLVPPGAPGAGDPTDIDPMLGTLHRGDIVVVKGEWIYDSLHHGWNEIHPVRACMVIGKMELSNDEELPWPPEFSAAEIELTIKRACAALSDADGAVEDGSQDDPQNGWVIHPLIDGCRPAIIT